MRASVPTVCLTDALHFVLTEHCVDFLNHSGASTVTHSENFTSAVMEFWE